MLMLYCGMLLCRVMQLAGWLSDKGVGRVTATAVVTILGGEITLQYRYNTVIMQLQCIYSNGLSKPSIPQENQALMGIWCPQQSLLSQLVIH